MSYAVDFKTVSTVGLESSPVAAALAGLRANEARYFKNKYDHVFTVEPASKAKKAIDWVHRILKEERDIVIASPPLEATAFQVENIRMAYVFYESGLSINVMYTIDDAEEAGRRVQALRRDGRPRGARHAVQVREAEVEAGRDHPRLVLRHQGRVLSPSAPGQRVAARSSTTARIRGPPYRPSCKVNPRAQLRCRPATLSGGSCARLRRA